MALTKLLYGYLHGMSRDFFVRFSTKSCRLWKNPLFRGDISVENPQRGALTGALRSGSPAGSWHPTKSFDFAGPRIQSNRAGRARPVQGFAPGKTLGRATWRGALTGALRSGSPAGSWHPTKSFDFAGPRIQSNRAGRARPVQGFAPGKTLGRATWRETLTEA